MIKQITVQDLKVKQASGKNFYFFDVRSREEWNEAKIPGARLYLDVPHEELDALDKNADIVFQCRSGGRSQKMAEAFEQHGFTNLFNLSGGILAWQQHS